MKKNKHTTMYQVMVTDTNHQLEIPVGPMMDVRDALLPLCEKINLSIAKGHIHGWKDAHVAVARQGA